MGEMPWGHQPAMEHQCQNPEKPPRRPLRFQRERSRGALGMVLPFQPKPPVGIWDISWTCAARANELLFQVWRASFLFPTQWPVLSLAGKTVLPIVWTSTTGNQSSSEPELLFPLWWFSLLFSEKREVLSLAGQIVLSVLQGFRQLCRDQHKWVR